MYFTGKRDFHMAVVRRKGGKRTKQAQYASPVRKMRRHKRKAHHMSSSTSSSGKDFAYNVQLNPPRPPKVDPLDNLHLPEIVEWENRHF